MPKWPEHYPRGGWPTKWPQVFVRFGDTWLRGSLWVRMEYAEGASYHTWYSWPGQLDLGPRRPRGCTGLQIEVGDALEPAEAGLLVALGAEVAHICWRMHHVEGADWCICDRCYAFGPRAES